MNDYIAALAAAFGLGVSVAAPVGPVATAVIREGLERGFVPAFLLGLGAATVDFLYIGLVYAGVAPLLLGSEWLVVGLHLFGGALLANLAYGSLKQAVRPLPAAGEAQGPTGRNAYLYGLGLTALNPATILLWLGLGSAFAASYMAAMTLPAAIGVVAAVGSGTAVWFAVIAAAAGGARRLAGGNPWLIRGVNAAAGMALGAYAIRFILHALQGV